MAKKCAVPMSPPLSLHAMHQYVRHQAIVPPKEKKKEKNLRLTLSSANLRKDITQVEAIHQHVQGLAACCCAERRKLKGSRIEQLSMLDRSLFVEELEELSSFASMLEIEGKLILI